MLHRHGGCTTFRTTVLALGILVAYASGNSRGGLALRKVTRATTHTFSGPRRVLSVGDLHGDFIHAENLLRNLSLIDEKGNWAGGRDILVQTGDVVDRGGRSKEIYEMLFRLQDQAPGQVFLLLGNHELKHMQGDDSDLSSDDAKDFGGVESCEVAFGPEGWIGKRLRQQPMVALLGLEQGLSQSVVYVHGGLLPSVAKSFGQHSASLAQHISGKGNNIQASMLVVDALNEAARKLLVGRGEGELSKDPSVLFGDQGPLWTRRLATDLDACKDLEETLAVLNATRMVVGHTPQRDWHVNCRCRGKLVLADTMISEAFDGNSHPSAVEVLPDGRAYALYPARGVRQELL